MSAGKDDLVDHWKVETHICQYLQSYTAQDKLLCFLLSRVFFEIHYYLYYLSHNLTITIQPSYTYQLAQRKQYSKSTDAYFCSKPIQLFEMIVHYYHHCL